MLVVARAEDDLHLRLQQAQLAKAGLAIEMGHGEVENDQSHLSHDPLVKLDRLAAIIDSEDGESRTLEHAAGKVAHALLIFDHQDLAVAPPGPVIGRGIRNLVRLRLGGREEQSEGRAAADLAVDIDGALVAAHDAQHSGQAQAAAGELGSEERIEDTILGCPVHAVSGVRHFHEHEVAGLDAVRGEAGLEIVGVAIGQAGGDGDDAAAITDGFRCVDDEIHDRLPNLGGVSLDRGQVLGEVVLEHDLLADAD